MLGWRPLPPIDTEVSNCAPHPWVDASVNNVSSLWWILRDNPWDNTGNAHQASWCMTQPGTCMHWDQSSDIWSQASLAHHSISLNWSRPLGTNGDMYWMVPSILWTSKANTVSANHQWLMMDWTLIHIFGRAATVKSCILKCIPMKSNSWFGVSSDFSRLMIHLRWRSTLMTSCTWELAISGESVRISQLSR